MSVTRNVLRGVLRSVTGSVIRAGVISRFFTPLDSSVTQYFGIPQIPSGTEITMFVYPTNGNVGLPLGAPAVTNNIFQIITFTLTANMDFIGRENTNYFDGFIADVVGGGRIYAIAENFGATSVLIDTGGTGQNGTAQNISTDSPFFTKQSDGNWLGVELITQAVWENPSTVDSEWTFANNQWTLTGQGGVNGLVLLSFADQPNVGRLEGNTLSISGGDLRVTIAVTPFVDSTGMYSFDIDKNVSSQRYARVSGNVNATLGKPSYRELLKVAA